MPGRFSLYDDRAKRVLALAQDEALRFRQPAIAPEHLLLAVIRAGTGDRSGSGSVGDALNSLGLPLGLTLAEAERKFILSTLEFCQGNRSKAARVLGMGRRTLQTKLSGYKD